MAHVTRTFTVAQLAKLGVPPDSPEDIEYSDTLLADEHVAVLKYSQQRRTIFRANGGIWAVEYEAPLDLGDFEVGAGDGTENHGWYGNTVEATAMHEQQVTVTKWLPVIVPSQRPDDPSASQ